MKGLCESDSVDNLKVVCEELPDGIITLRGSMLNTFRPDKHEEICFQHT